MENNNSKVAAVTITVLVMMVLGLGGFIVYDKVINKEVSPVNNNLNQESQSTNEESGNKQSDVNKYYKTETASYTLDSKIYNIEFKYSLLEINNDIRKYNVDIFINNKIIDNYSFYDDTPNERNLELLESHEIIGADRKYAAIIIKKPVFANSKKGEELYILNEDEDVIQKIKLGGGYKILNQNMNRSYGDRHIYFDMDAIYIVALDCKNELNEINNNKFGEYKLTLNNNIVNFTKIGTYDIELVGGQLGCSPFTNDVE